MHEPSAAGRHGVSVALCALMLAAAMRAGAQSNPEFGAAEPSAKRSGPPDSRAAAFAPAPGPLPGPRSGSAAAALFAPRCAPATTGEDFATAIGIDSLPFTAAASTCGLRNDYDAACAFLVGAPDQVYVYTPARDECVRIDLCGSGFDTVVHVYENDASTLVACNDDHCRLGSRIGSLSLLAGRRYYIVVDGWYTFCGDYVLDVRPCPPPCAQTCPEGALAEGEAACSDGSVDTFDTGCNIDPPVFRDLPCNEAGVTVHGTYGTFAFGSNHHRDTDWYRVTVSSATRLDYRVRGDAPTQIAILDASAGCSELSVVCGSLFGDACDALECQAEVPAGTYWLFVATAGYAGVPCGTGYLLELHGTTCPPIAVRSTTWSQVKRLYHVP